MPKFAKAPVLAVCLLLAASVLPGGRLAAQVHREVELPLQNGRLSVLALSRALCDEYGYAGDQLNFPDVRIDVSGVKGNMLLLGVGKSLMDTVRFQKKKDGTVLVLRIDQARARAVRHKFKRRLGRALSVLAGRDIMARSYRLDLPAGLGTAGSVVLCVHGVDATHKSFDDMRAFLGAGEAPVRSGTFTYANDEAIDRIAGELAKRLVRQKQTWPAREIILVAHSMGGLVCRYMLETKARDPGNVTTLIMLGTPNHGSRLSRLRPGVDLLEFLRDHGDDPQILSPWLDGMGEAGWDMWPDSPFLAALNARPRNAKVRYHLILGDAGIVSAADMKKWRDEIMAKVSRLEKSEIYGKKIATWLDDLHEVVQGQGDGAVSLQRGRLQGVQAVVVPMGHNSMLRAPPVGSKQPVFEQVRIWIADANRR